MVADEEGQPEFRPVTIGLTVASRTQILRGVQQGERVYLELPENMRGE